jgi:uncharacterized RDD family membrane protein YckC
MGPERTGVMSIQTPEGIVFPLVLAGPVTRFLAVLLDAACVNVILMIVSVVFLGLGFLSVDLLFAFYVLCYFVVSIGYPIATEWYWRGQTIGKRLLKLRVMDSQGLRLQFSQIVIRNLLRFVDMLPAFYLVGGVTCLINKHAQRLGDIAANTIVVRNPEISEPDLAQIMSGKYNSFRDYPHLAARLRQRVSPQEASIALQALLRRDELEPVARVELFSEIAGHIRRIVEFPSEAVDGITDEQYIRNVLDLLFRKAI